MQNDHTFYKGSFDADWEDEEVTNAVAYAELAIELKTSSMVSFPDSIEMQIDVSDYDGELDQDADEDLNAYVTYFNFSSITGTIDNIEMSDKNINKVVEYCESRKLVLDTDENEEFYCTKFIKEFNKKPITKLLIDTYFKYLTDGDIEIEEAEIFELHVVSTAEPLKTFSDSIYGNLEGKTVNENIDMSGYNLKSLKGSPKIVQGEFNIRGNDLSDLKYGPESVRVLYANNISDLQYLPHIKNINNSSIQVSFGKDSKLLREELKFRLDKNDTYGISSRDIRLKIYEETGNEIFLPDEVQDIFLF